MKKNEFNCKDIVITEQNTKALIISKDDENSILDTVILPISSNLLDDMFPYRVRIQNRDNLIDDSDILINQITTLNKFKIKKEKIAKLTQEEYDLVIQALCKNFK